MTPSVAPQPRARRASPTEAPSPGGSPSSGAAVQLVSWLQELASCDGSDLHVKVGSPPMIREVGRLRRLQRPPVGARELAELAGAIVPPNRKENGT